MGAVSVFETSSLFHTHCVFNFIFNWVFSFIANHSHLNEFKADIVSYVILEQKAITWLCDYIMIGHLLSQCKVRKRKGWFFSQNLYWGYPIQVTLHKKWCFPLRISSVIPADLVTFTEEILNGKLHFLCSVISHFWVKPWCWGQIVIYSSVSSFDSDFVFGITADYTLHGNWNTQFAMIKGYKFFLTGGWKPFNVSPRLHYYLGCFFCYEKSWFFQLFRMLKVSDKGVMRKYLFRVACDFFTFYKIYTQDL